MTEPRTNVMISSTRHDLAAHIEAAKAAIAQCGMDAVMQEDLPALDADAIDVSLAMVEQAAVYVGIFAHRYGYWPTDPRNPHGISITEMEYNRAVELNRPRLIFVVSDDHTPDLDRSDGPGAEKLAAFKQRVMTDRVVYFFTSADDLRGAVVRALEHWQAQRLLWMPDPLPERGHLPTDHLLPPGSRVGMPLNIHFVGREDSLVALADTLLHGADDAKTVITPAAAATGSGGIGKTQLAVEFAHRYGRYFYGVHWINLLGVEGDDLGPRLRAEIAACGAEMALPHWPEDDLPKQVEMTLAAWRESPPRLIILDNAETPEAVQHALDMLRGALVLVTSRWGRARDWANIGVDARPLDTLTRDQSIDLLRRLAPHLRETEESDLDMLAARLGDFPLALDLAGRYLDDMYTEGEPVSVQDFLTELEAQALDHTALRGWASQADIHSPTQHDMDVRATFLVSWGRVTNPLARRLFRACGYLAPNAPIPADLLRAIADTQGAPLVLARKQLAQPGLLTPHSADDPLLSIHPLLADFARELDAQEDEEDKKVPSIPTLAHVVNVLAALTKTANETGLPTNFVSLRPHVEVVATHADTARIADVAALWNDLGSHLVIITDYVPARQHLERAFTIIKHVFGSEHSSIATILNNLGQTLHALGDFVTARQHYEHAIAINQRIYGPEHPDVALVLNNLGNLLHSLGNLPAAHQHFERALVILEQGPDPNHPLIATLYNSLGMLLYTLGDLPAARLHFERALNIIERTLPPDHPHIAKTLHNLGILLKDLGDLSTAREYLERALASTERIFGADHPTIAIHLNGLAHVLQALGDRFTARQFYERALAITEHALGPNHPDVATRLSDLGELLHDLGDLPAARQCLERALAISEHVYGPYHPQVAIVLNNLGELLRVLGDLHTARPYFERALMISEHIHGPNHPSVAIGLNNLGMLLKNQDDLPAAWQHFERALAIIEHIHGPNHPDTAFALNNLAMLLKDLGDLPTARQHLERALRLFEATLPPSHPNIRVVRNNLAGLDNN